MILPETVQAGDILGIFSTDGRTYRGTARVREMFPGPPPQIGFDGPLPVGTTQGDILCLIRRGDVGTQIEAIMPTDLVVPISAYSGAIQAVQQVQFEREVYKAECSSLREQIARLNHERDEQIRNLTSILREYSNQIADLRKALDSQEKQKDITSLPIRRIKSSSK